jgi:hypothetical protein
MSEVSWKRPGLSAKRIDKTWIYGGATHPDFFNRDVHTNTLRDFINLANGQHEFGSYL